MKNLEKNQSKKLKMTGNKIALSIYEKNSEGKIIFSCTTFGNLDSIEKTKDENGFYTINNKKYIGNLKSRKFLKAEEIKSE